MLTQNLLHSLFTEIKGTVSLSISKLQVSHIYVLSFKSKSFLTVPQFEQVLLLGKNLSILVTFALYSKILTNSLKAKSKKGLFS